VVLMLVKLVNFSDLSKIRKQNAASAQHYSNYVPKSSVFFNCGHFKFVNIREFKEQTSRNSNSRVCGTNYLKMYCTALYTGSVNFVVLDKKMMATRRRL